jgi:hypothetical protein
MTSTILTISPRRSLFAKVQRKPDRCKDQSPIAHPLGLISSSLVKESINFVMPVKCSVIQMFAHAILSR